MDKFTYKEKDKALFLLEKGFSSNHYQKTDMLILMKYFRFLGYEKKQAKEEVFSLLKKTVVGIEDEEYKKIVSNIANSVYTKDKKIIQVDKIDIYKEELDFINSLEIKHTAKKLLFAFLCFKKIEFQVTDGKVNMNYYSEKDYKTKNLKQMYGSNMNIDMQIYYLSTFGLVENAYNTDTRLMFMDMIGETKELAFEISRFEDTALFFDRYNGVGKIKECTECGKLIKVKSKTKTPKYCDECAKMIKNEQNKTYYRNNLGNIQ